MEITEDIILESVAELMDDADAMLEQAGIQIDESVISPEEFIEAIAEVLDDNDLDEDLEAALCLNVALIERFLLDEEESDGVEEAEDADESVEAEGPPLDEKSTLSRLHKSLRRSIEKRAPMGTHWKHSKGDKLAAKEPQAMLRHYLDKRDKVLPMKAPAHAMPGDKKHAAEEIEDPSPLVNRVVEMIEAAGYEVPEDLEVSDFLESVEALALTDKAVAEGLGTALAGAGIKMLKSKTASWAANKLARAGTKAIVKKLKKPADPAQATP